MTIKITLCQPKQLTLLREISMQTYRDTFSDNNSEALMQQYFNDAMTSEKLLQEINTQGSYFYFIYLNNEVAGFLKVNEGQAQTDKVTENSLEIERFYIGKQYLRNGLGKQLMEFVCELAKKSNYASLWLDVWEGNCAALAFYKKQGFYQIGEHPFDMGGDIQTDLLFKRDL
ncbi:GNAT family N-acetyltransferase [Psychromonas hadalis]|uniref:GNAT family N-acetyltransferase n=1 Tax=Psychromonas hadalis TaxID=211669 RepID=UPI0003B3708A|nr:GNAT family N-acetyltransferase [Psychromonas hadalis]